MNTRAFYDFLRTNFHLNLANGIYWFGLEHSIEEIYAALFEDGGRRMLETWRVGPKTLAQLQFAARHFTDHAP